jgi:hypothetical protein
VAGASYPATHERRGQTDHAADDESLEHSFRRTGMTRKHWTVVHYLLYAAFILTAALNMLHVHGGFLTNHAADLVVPVWLYVVMRGLHSTRGRTTIIQRIVGRTPEGAAIILFIASAATEVSQYYWPRGLFRGRFDLLDIVAYAVGLAACYLADRFLSRDGTPPDMIVATPAAPVVRESGATRDRLNP